MRKNEANIGAKAGPVGRKSERSGGRGARGNVSRRARSEAAALRTPSDASAVYARTAVIGAGASGLAAAVAAGSRSDVLVIDGNDKVGKKLCATGNGRCNFTNAHCSSEDYNRAEDGFVDAVFDVFSPEDTLNFFQDSGMMIRLEDGGRYYPYSGQAASLVELLRREAERRGCRFLLSDKAVQTGLVERDGSEIGAKRPSGAVSSRFFIVLESGKKVFCDRLVIACGGRAGLKTGSTGDGYGFAKAFGHTLAAPRPALTAVESDDAFLADLKGVRAKGSVSLYRDGGKIAEDSGEIQFTGSGVSGICVFNLTRHMEAARPVGQKKKKSSGLSLDAGMNTAASERSGGEKRASEEKSDREGPIKDESENFVRNRKTEPPSAVYEIRCDFVPEWSRLQLADMILAQISRNEGIDSQRTLEEVLEGIVNDKLAKVIARLSVRNGRREEDGFEPPDAKYDSEAQNGGAPRRGHVGAPEERAKRAAHLLKELKIFVSHTRGWNDAQVTCGGVRREEIEPRTMESKLVRGLYFCGEVVDVDGKCGGYNLQWAWSSGATAGRFAVSGRE